jgi:hypothetical protein
MHLFDECSWRMKEKCSRKKTIHNRKMFDSFEINAHVRQALLLSHAMINQQSWFDDELTQWR